MSSTDLPEQTNSQQAQLLISAVEQADDSVLITEGAPLDPPGPKITYVNSAFTEMTGYEAEEVIGQTPRLLQGPATETWVLDRLRHSLEQERSFKGEAINYRKDGTPFINSWSISPVRNANGTLTHWVAIQRDVTEQRNTSIRLLQAQEKERAQISRVMHDELGGQLASLQMLTQRISDQVSADDQEVASLLNQLQNQIDTLSGSVRHLTDASSSRVLSDFGLTEAIHRLADEYSDEYGLSIELHNEISSGERLSPVLEHVLFRILRETLTNVAQYAGTDLVQVLLNKTDQELRVHVIDQGEGFDPSGKRDSESAFGLSAMLERIDRLNGRFTINSQPEEGTRLTITLPLAPLSLSETQSNFD